MKTPIRILTVLALALSFFVSASAQTSTTGSIEGTVTDVNGAAVPGVTVTVTGPNLLHPQSGTTNAEGLYHIQNIPPGIYTVTVEAAKNQSLSLTMGPPMSAPASTSEKPFGAAPVKGMAEDFTSRTKLCGVK